MITQKTFSKCIYVISTIMHEKGESQERGTTNTLVDINIINMVKK